MSIKQALVDVFQHPWIKKLPARSLVASALAAMIHPALAAVDFDLSAATSALAHTGFKIGNALLPIMVNIAKAGAEALADWLEKELFEEPDVNEAAATTMVEQVEVVAQALEETHPNDKQEIAEAVATGLKEYGGATSEIAERYGATLKDARELAKLVDEMRAAIGAWGQQTVEAKRGSLIENVNLQMKGKGGKQTIRAEDDSSINGVKMSIE